MCSSSRRISLFTSKTLLLHLHGKTPDNNIKYESKLQHHPNSPLVFSWFRVTRSLVFCVVFCKSFITGVVTKLTRRMPLVEQELPTLLEHMSSPPVFSGVRVTRSLVLCVCLVDHCLSICVVSFGHCGFCPSIYGL